MVYDTGALSSATSSPTSSPGSHQAGLDDSQNTTITEPDDVAVFVQTIARTVPVRLTTEEIREVGYYFIPLLQQSLTPPRKPKYSNCG